MNRLLLSGCASLALIAASTSANARVTRIEITRQKPFAAGQTFGTVGAYEKVVGRYHGELDPKNPLNAAIVDLDKAPRNARGMVEPPTSTFSNRSTSARATARCSTSSAIAATRASSPASTMPKAATTPRPRSMPATAS
jgi:hypothetical protein